MGCFYSCTTAAAVAVAGEEQTKSIYSEDGSISEGHSNTDNSNAFDCLAAIPKKSIDNIIRSGIVLKPYSPHHITLIYFLKTPITLTFLKSVAERRNRQVLIHCWTDLMSVKESDESEDMKGDLLVQLHGKYSADVRFSANPCLALKQEDVTTPLMCDSTFQQANASNSTGGYNPASYKYATNGSMITPTVLTAIRSCDVSPLVSQYSGADGGAVAIPASAPASYCEQLMSKVIAVLNRMLLDVLMQIYQEILYPGTAKTVDDMMKPLLKSILLRKRFPVGVADYSYEKVLGEGSFGMVVLCKKNTTGLKYAMKIQDKDEMLLTHDEDPDADLCGESKIMGQCSHPFIARLHCAFQTQKLNIMVMDYAFYGDMSSYMKSQEMNHLPLQTARFYIAELVSAVSYLHEKGFMHRDIKPGNLLINKDRHLQLTDFGSVLESKQFVKQGLSTKGESKFLKQIRKEKTRRGSALFQAFNLLGSSSSQDSAESASDKYPAVWQPSGIAGTEAYMAPEVQFLMSMTPRARQNVSSYYYYTKACDWWSVGATAFKLMMGTHAITKMTIRDIVHEYRYAGGAGDYEEYLRAYWAPPSEATKHLAQEVVPQPARLSNSSLPCHEALMFVQALLDVNFVSRLGSNPQYGGKQVKEHVFFNHIDWQKLKSCELVPPPFQHAKLKSVSSLSKMSVKLDMFEGKWAKRLAKLTSKSSKNEFNHNFEKILVDVGRSEWLPENLQKFASISMGKTFKSSSEKMALFKEWDFVSDVAIFDELELSNNQQSKINV